MLKSESSDEKSFCGHEPGRDGCIDLIYSIIGGGVNVATLQSACVIVTARRLGIQPQPTVYGCVVSDGQKIGLSTATNRVWLRGQLNPCLRSPLRIWSRETGSAVLFRSALVR